MSKYVELLRLLLSYGDKLPALLSHLERIIDEVGAILSLLGMDSTTFASEAPTPEVLSLEAEVCAAGSGETGMYAGPLTRLMEFIRNNPELIALLLSLLKK